MNLHIYEPSQISASRVALENVPIKLKQTTGSSKPGYHNTGKNPVYYVLYGIIIYYVLIQSVLCPAAAA